MSSRLQILAVALAVALAPALGYGPGNPPPGVTDFSGGPIALDTVHGRIFLCDSANNRVLVYGFSSQGGLLGTAPLAVIGQIDANGTAVNGMDIPTPNGCGLAHPTGIAYDAARDGLWVSDFLNNRVLFFSTRTLRTFQPADHVIGQTGLGYSEPRAGARGLCGPTGLALSGDGQQLFIADSLNNRVVSFDISELARHPAAIGVFGQKDFWQFEPGASAGELRSPTGIALDAAGQLYVADTGNNRVLVFDAGAKSAGAAACTVFGQEDFKSIKSASGVSGLKKPAAIALAEADRLMFVADTGNHRVLVYDGLASDPLRAIAVIGQPNTTSSDPQPSDKGLDDPVGVLFDTLGQKLWVSETGNARVGFYKLGQ
ncbi:MAG: NHL repeat-containing protein [Verrucomicrobia bacterium]|nr:NHL repeat-containing protein [Verrucomicrobiota bacterium]